MTKLTSKLNSQKYACVADFKEIKKSVSFASGVDPYLIDPVLLGRFAALCRHLGVIGHITSGTRTIARQIQLYLADGGRRLPNGEWAGGTGYVAKPGRSFHNYGLAIDTSTPKIKALEKEASFRDQRVLASFGLCKPLTKGNRQKILEDWHIQPIETINISLEGRRALAPTGLDVAEPPGSSYPALKQGDHGDHVRMLQLKLTQAGIKVSVDGSFGPGTHKAVIEYQRKNGLTPDGVVGPKTWAKIL